MCLPVMGIMVPPVGKQEMTIPLAANPLLEIGIMENTLRSK